MSPVSTLSDRNAFTYAAGDVIADKYALEQLLGTGGMGAVFRARNLTIDMPVALKLIRADLDREQLSGRLLQEARAAAKLAHPAIVRVFDVGQTALGDPFIVMELLHGESLAKVLDREGRLSSVRAVQLLLPIADALSMAHAKGFVHRDVKPDNVFIANDEEGQLQPKLVDFGIVKHERQEGDSKLTQVGAVLGSPDYMSPEQARGLETIDQRSDVWSFSVVLYETIAGVAPFEGANYNALLRMIVETEPLSLRDQCAADADLSELVARGLSKQPSLRFASMGLMGKALATWLSAQGVTADACGVSLEARWLSRATDPAALGRPSRSSSPDSWPEPPSGVRAVSSSLGLAPTVAVARPSVTPYSATKPSTGWSPHKRRIYFGLAAAGTLVALLLGWFAAGRGEPADEASAAATSVPAPARERPTTLTPTLPPSAASPAVVVRLETPEPFHAPKAASSSPLVPAGKAAPNKAPSSAAKAAGSASPRSDLLSPY